MQDLPNENTSPIENLLQKPIIKCDNIQVSIPKTGTYWSKDRVQRLKRAMLEELWIVVGPFEDPQTNSQYLSITSSRSTTSSSYLSCVVALVDEPDERCAYSASLKLTPVSDEHALSILKNYFAILDGA